MDDMILTIVCATIVVAFENLLIFGILYHNIIKIHDEIRDIIKISDKENNDVANKIRSTNENVQKIYDFVHIDSIDKTNKLEEICQQITENNKAKNSSIINYI